MKLLCCLGMLMVIAGMSGCRGDREAAKRNAKAEVATSAKVDPELVTKKEVDTASIKKSEPLKLFRWPLQAVRFDVVLDSELSAPGGESMMTVKLAASLDVMAVEGGENGRVVFALVDSQLSVSGAKDGKKMAARRQLKFPVALTHSF